MCLTGPVPAQRLRSLENWPLPTARIMIDKGVHGIGRAAKKMIPSLVDAMDYIANNRAKTIEYVASKWKLSREFAEQMLVKDFIPLLTMDGRMTAQGVQDHLDTEYQNKLIGRKAQASEVMDLTMLEE